MVFNFFRDFLSEWNNLLINCAGLLSDFNPVSVFHDIFLEVMIMLAFPPKREIKKIYISLSQNRK